MASKAQEVMLQQIYPPSVAVIPEGWEYRETLVLEPVVAPGSNLMHTFFLVLSREVT